MQISITKYMVWCKPDHINTNDIRKYLVWCRPDTFEETSSCSFLFDEDGVELWKIEVPYNKELLSLWDRIENIYSYSEIPTQQ